MRFRVSRLEFTGQDDPKRGHRKQELSVVPPGGRWIGFRVELGRHQPIQALQRLRLFRIDVRRETGPHPVPEIGRAYYERQGVLSGDLTGVVATQEQATVLAADGRSDVVNGAATRAEGRAGLAERGRMVRRDEHETGSLEEVDSVARLDRNAPVHRSVAAHAATHADARHEALAVGVSLIAVDWRGRSGQDYSRDTFPLSRDDGEST